MLPFKYDVGETLLDVKAWDQESDAIVLIRAANTVRKEIFQKQYKFIGSLIDEHYYDKPASFTALVQMILGGTNIQPRRKITMLSKQLLYQHLGKARDFKNHVTPAVFSFVVTSTFV